MALPWDGAVRGVCAGGSAALCFLPKEISAGPGVQRRFGCSPSPRQRQRVCGVWDPLLRHIGALLLSQAAGEGSRATRSPSPVQTSTSHCSHCVRAAAPAGAGGAAELRTTLQFSSPPCSKRCNRCQAPFPPAEKFPTPHNEAGHPSCIPSRPGARVSPAGYRSLARGEAQREHQGVHQEPRTVPRCLPSSLGFGPAGHQPNGVPGARQGRVSPQTSSLFALR